MSTVRTGLSVSVDGFIGSVGERAMDDHNTIPFHAPVFVLTSRPRGTDVREGGTSFTFVTGGIDEAIARAKEAADGKDVFISGGGSPVHQALAAGLLDEVQMHVVPVLLGDGVRMFDQVDPRQFTLERTQVLAGDGVTHLTYRVVR